MKKILIALTIIFSSNVLAVGSDGTGETSQICFKVGSDGTGNKVGSDGTGNKVGSDGTGNKVGSDGTGQTSICQTINIEEKESFFNFEFNRY